MRDQMFRRELERLLGAVDEERRPGVRETVQALLELDERHEAGLGQGNPPERLERLQGCLEETLAVLRARLPGWWRPEVERVVDLATEGLRDLCWREVRWLTRKVDGLPVLPQEQEHPMTDLRLVMSWCAEARVMLSPVPAAEAALEMSTGILWYEREPYHVLDGDHDLQVMRILAERSPNTVTREIFKKRVGEVDVWRVKDRHIKAGWREELFWSQGKNGIGFKVRVEVVGEDETKGA